MAQLITVRLNKSDQQPLGFRLQGGKDFGTPLVVQKVNGGSAAERAGLQAGDALIRVNNTDVYTLRHQDAQDAIRAAGLALELTVQRGGGTWRPSVTPTGSLPRPGSRLGSTPTPVTNTSLKATPQPSRAFGSGHNNVAKPFGYTNGNDAVKSIVNKQYNTPVNMYSDKTIAETLSAQTEVLAGGVLGVNFKKNEKTYDAEKSAVFKVLQEEQNDPEPEMVPTGVAPPITGLRHVTAPTTRPDAPINNTGGLPPGQNICEDCERLITGVFVRIKDKNLHVECFKCATCGTSLKNQGYYNLNGKLYCDIHAKLVSRQNPPAPNLEPVTVPPGGRIPTNAYSTPLPPLSTNNYTNGSSSMFSPSSTLSGPKPFGSSMGSAYSPSASLSPRSAPLSPARPAVVAPPPSVATPTFAPTKNIKSVVWPPQNPSEDMTEIKQEVSEKSLLASQTNSEKIIMPDVENLKNIFEQNISQEVSSSQKVSEFCTGSSYSSTSMAAVASTTSTATKSEVLSQNLQSALSTSVEMQQTSSVTQAISEQRSENRTLKMYQSETSQPIQNAFESVKESNEAVKSNEEVQATDSFIVNENMVFMQNKDDMVPNVVSKENESSKYECQRINEHDRMAMTKDSESVIVEDIKNKEISEKISNESVAQNAQSVESRTTEDLNSCKMDLLQKTTCSMPLTQTSISNPVPRSYDGNMIDAIKTEHDIQSQPVQTHTLPKAIEVKQQNNTIPEQKRTQIPPPSPMFNQKPCRGITPIPPIKQYNPPEKAEAPVSMPPETQPYIPPDFKIVIEPKMARDREAASSPLVDALTTAPDRPFTPIMHQSIERGSLRDALTIAPERSYSPLPLSATNQTHVSTSLQSSSIQVQSTSSQIVKPIATQTTSQTIEKVQTEFSSLQNTCKLQSSSDTSAFRPVGRQVFPPPQPDEFCKLTNFPPISNELKTSFEKATRKHETTVAETQSFQSSMTTSSINTQTFSSVKTAQTYFEQLDQKEALSSTAVRSKAGLHKPDNIPSYQRNFEQLLSQRGITPEICNAPAILQRPVTPTTEPPTKPREKSQEPKAVPTPIQKTSTVQTLKSPATQPTVLFHKDAPISMTFQPVSEDSLLRVSPGRSRSTTPSLINKPAPIIPHYQMNLVTVEHLAPETNMFNPSSPEGSRSPTPKPRSRSPAQGPPANPLKAQAPRIKDNIQHRDTNQSLLSKATSNLRKEHEIALKSYQSNEVFNASGARNWSQNQPSITKEQISSSVAFATEKFEKEGMNIKEDSMLNQNYAQREMQAENIAQYGSTTIQSTRRTFEEFERTQSAKVVEIRKGGSTSSDTYQSLDANVKPSSVNPKQVFPPPVMSVTSQKKSSETISNQNVNNSRNIGIPQPMTSGANLSPVCDPTPSAGSGVGGPGRGKTFGVSSAPKRGKGVLNKAALPGSRVPLCASCNGNIRGPFITALGRIWCPEHFICVNATCRRPLQDIGFVEENGQLYCEYCFEQYIAPACDKCHSKIKGDCLNAIGKHFHPECFSCVYCGKLFGNHPFFLEDGLPYCEADWNELFTTKCFACGFPVEAGDRWVEALNNNYHSQCFNCTVCKKNLEGQSFFAKGGRPFCKMHAR